MFDVRCTMDDVESARWTSRSFKAEQSNSRSRVFTSVDVAAANRCRSRSSQISSYRVLRRLEQTIERMSRPISRGIRSQATRTVLEEADESLYWLELIREGKLIAETKLSLSANRGGRT